MQTFIEKVLTEEQKLKKYSKVYILPSRRAGSVLRQQIATDAKVTTFAPQIYSIEEFIEHVSGCITATQTELTFTLYESYKNVTESDIVSFQVFCGWSQPILGDFNEIDRHLIDQYKIFNHLKDIKNISDHWSSSTNELVVKYLKFWNSLSAIYSDFIEKTLAENKVHQGLVYRQAVDNIEHYKTSNSELRHIFLGFNALNNAEQHIIQALLADDKNSIYWDADHQFVYNTSHEAGSFYRAYLKNWPYYKTQPFQWIDNTYVQKKDIHSYAVSQNIHQAKTVGAILSGYTLEQISNTAIILGEESLLIPILNSMPKEVQSVNITMGIPLGKTPTSSFIQALLTLKKRNDERGYYYKDLLAVIQHPIAITIGGQHLKSVKTKILIENKIFITQEEITKHLGISSIEFINCLFKPWENNAYIALENLIKIIHICKSAFTEQNDALQLEYIFGFYKAFNKLKQLIEKTDYIEDVATLIHFYREVISSETIDVRGDRNKGLQIMGVLESRVLDYERVIVTSLNEGILPSGKSQNSYIPYDLKTLYKLPTYAEKDAIYAYHFYHLLHRSKHVELIYTTESEGMGSAEPSRFIKQLIQENIHHIKEHIVSPPVLPINNNKLKIFKSDVVLEKIAEYFKKGISPSAISTYLRNPILFYERYILGVKESNDVEETIAANTMGTIVHNTLEKLYTPFVSKQLTVEIVEQLIVNFESEVKLQFKQEYGLDYILEGKNHIIYRVVCRFIQNYLTIELKRIRDGDVVIIKSIEDNLKDIPFLENINLRGKVDLVEIRNGNLNIIDYKTGKVQQSDLRLKDWQDLLQPEGKSEKAFQVLMYAYMMHKKRNLTLPLNVGVISFKNLKSGYLPFSFDKDESVTEETLVQFENILKLIVLEILNPEIPFEERD